MHVKVQAVSQTQDSLKLAMHTIFAWLRRQQITDSMLPKSPSIYQIKPTTLRPARSEICHIKEAIDGRTAILW